MNWWLADINTSLSNRNRPMKLIQQILVAVCLALVAWNAPTHAQVTDAPDAAVAVWSINRPEWSLVKISNCTDLV